MGRRRKQLPWISSFINPLDTRGTRSRPGVPTTGSWYGCSKRHGFGNGISFEGVSSQRRVSNAPPRPATPVGTACLREPGGSGSSICLSRSRLPTNRTDGSGCGIRAAPSANLSGGSGAHGLPRFCRQPDVQQNNGGGMRWTAEYPSLHGFRNFFAKGFAARPGPGRGRPGRVFRYRELRFSPPGRSVAGRPRLGLHYRQQVLPESCFRDVQEGSEASGSRTCRHGKRPMKSAAMFWTRSKRGSGATLHWREGIAYFEVFLRIRIG